MMVVYCGSLAITASILMASVAVSEALNRSANRERKFLPNLIIPVSWSCVRL
jgi:hypothetical protein